jgi:hypothetical protein
MPVSHCRAVCCKKRIPSRLLMCKRHWDLVPKPLRRALWSTYRTGENRSEAPSRAYLGLVSDAVAAVARLEGRAA